jgi:putative peptide modification system cyclase
MNVHASPAPNASAVPLVPVLRTVLLADLVDSTALLHQLGDVRAATLLQRLELHLRDLFVATHGQLIDKADGVLALFERPVLAVDFALRYQRMLHQLGVEFGVPDLRARVGIHVGEVMTWANDPRAVAAGAKPLEVEGLAKPVAARLMALALPGQVLLSGMAQTLAQRASGELGDRGARLRWLVHGRYRFKGVPAPMLVHEAGEPGISPLRAPPSGQKVWREVPLWRRPPVLALEALAVVGLVGASLFGAFRSEPVLAFNQRDWVVVGDLNNLTGEARLTDPLETALRIGLQQSAYVNLISDIRVDETLERMGRESDTPVDRAIGSEIAQREGARALIIPTVSEVGGSLQVSIEVIDPSTQATVYTESAAGEGESSILASLDAVNVALRTRLGESVQQIEATTRPLARVTTDNIDALRAYSLAQQAKADSRHAEARDLYEEAVRLDANFAVAYIGLASLDLMASDNVGALRNFHMADVRRDRLSLRESMFLDAAASIYQPPGPTLKRWRLLANMYPDEFRAHYNFALFSHNDAQDYEGALAFLAPALSIQNPRQRNAYYLQGYLLRSLGRYKEAESAFQQAESLGVGGYVRDYAEIYAVQRDYERGFRVLSERGRVDIDSLALEQRLTEVTFAVDQGDWPAALRNAAELEALAADSAPLVSWTFQGMHLGLRSYDPDPAFASDVRDYLQARARLLPSADPIEARYLQFEALAAGWFAARAGDLGTARESLALAAEPARASGYIANADMALSLAAEIALAEGRAAEAVTALRDRAARPDSLYLLHAVLMRAYEASDDRNGALREAGWLVAHRGLAYGEFNSQHLLQPINVAESNFAIRAAAEHARALGRLEEADKHQAAFAAAWPRHDFPQVRRRRAGGAD